MPLLMVQGTRLEVRTPLLDVRTLHMDRELSGEEDVEFVELWELSEVLHLRIGGSGSLGTGVGVRICPADRMGYLWLHVMADIGVMEQSPGG